MTYYITCILIIMKQRLDNVSESTICSQDVYSTVRGDHGLLS